LLEGYFTTRQIQARYSYGTRYRFQLGHHYELLLNSFVSSLDMSTSSRKCCESISREFFYFMKTHGIESAKQITQKDIQQYITENAGAYTSRIGSFLWALRKLVGYLKNAIDVDITDQVVSLKGRRSRRRVFPAFTDDEMTAILTQPDLETAMGKRDYAVILLASYTGFRSVDIANMKLQDINWLEKTVTVVQRKTGIPNSLPLEQEVLTAIANYILNGRAETTSDNLFITAVPPYRPLSIGSSVGNILKKHMKQAGITHNPWDGKGFHAIRRRMGMCLLEASIPIEMISQVLGHTEMDSAKHYLPMNTGQLGICAIGFSDIPIIGGVYA
jgi:site-specific recombinase XerD